MYFLCANMLTPGAFIRVNTVCVICMITNISCISSTQNTTLNTVVFNNIASSDGDSDDQQVDGPNMYYLTSEYEVIYHVITLTK